MKIDTVNWKSFDISELFTAKNTGNILKRDIEDGSGNIPFVTASAFNNGVVAYIDKGDYELIKGHCILVGGKTFTMTYQENDFLSNDSHNFELRLKDTSLSRYVYLFLIAAIKKSTHYSWDDAVTKDKLLAEKIMLPSIKNKPDWLFMENYMKNLEEKTDVVISQLLIVSEKEKCKVDTKDFKRFHLYDEGLFTIDSGTKLDKAKMSNKDPSVNFVGRANANNGVTDYIDLIDGLEPYESGLMTISLGGEYLGSCFVQDKPFYTSQNVNVLIPQNPMSYYCKKYIAAMVFKEGRLHYKAFIDELNRHMKTDFTIPLPVDKNGVPDWTYMENYMLYIEKKAQNNIKLLNS